MLAPLGDVRMPFQQPDHPYHLLNEHLHGGSVGKADDVETRWQSVDDRLASGQRLFAVEMSHDGV